MSKQAMALGAMAAVVLATGSPAVHSASHTENYLYATYHYCSMAGQDRADQIMAGANQAEWGKAVGEGLATGWLWIAHHTGGKWRRISVHTAPTMDALFKAQETVGDRIDKADPKGSKEFSTICSSHDDYIWRTVANGGAQGKALFSVYYVCDSRREGQADALVKKVFAPMYDKMVADGMISGWGWHEHIVGGKFRRLATMSAADVPALMKARGALVQQMVDNPLGNAFNDICDTHDDYIWEVRGSKP